MTKKGARKSQGKREDELVKRLFSGSQSETEPSPVKTSQKKISKEVVRDSAQDDNASMNIKQNTPSAKTQGVAKKIPKPKSSKKTPKLTPSDLSDVGPKAADSDDDGEHEVIFNFEVRSANKNARSLQTDMANPQSTSILENQVTKSLKSTLKPSKVKSSTESKVDAAAMATIETPEAAQDLKDVAMQTVVAEGKRPDQWNRKEQSGDKQKSRKRKASHHQNDIPLKKSSKANEDIFFYCGNLPPGVTSETLSYFLEEEGIHPKVILNRKRQHDQSIAMLTHKQRQYKKNQIKAAKSFFATVIVKTEEEAKKMLFLNGINMPSPSNRDWDTELKIVRRLPRSDKFPYKVHVSGLHPRITEEGLKHYLESRGINPGMVVISRTQKTQKSKRFGFVWFESVPEADKAVDLAEPFMRDRPLVIQHSFKKKFKNF